jgi:hypothetical protein
VTRPRVRQLVEAISDGNDGGTRRNLGAAQPAEVPAAVRLFMVGGDQRNQRRERRDIREYPFC